MFYRILIDVVIVSHGLFIVYVTFGGFLTWQWPRSAWAHLPLCTWAVLISFFQWPCPLTHVENWLRRQQGSTSLDGGYIDHYLTPLIYPADTSTNYFITLGLCLVAINSIAYLKLYGTNTTTTSNS